MLNSPASLLQNEAGLLYPNNKTEMNITDANEKRPDQDTILNSSDINKGNTILDYSLSHSSHPVSRQIQKNTSSMSVTSKNITTANYLNQNNQFITSQPLPIQRDSLNLFGAEGQTKNGLEELERRLLELEKSTQNKHSSSHTELTLTKNSQNRSGVFQQSQGGNNNVEEGTRSNPKTRDSSTDKNQLTETHKISYSKHSIQTRTGPEISEQQNERHNFDSGNQSRERVFENERIFVSNNDTDAPDAREYNMRNFNERNSNIKDNTQLNLSIKSSDKLERSGNIDVIDYEKINYLSSDKAQRLSHQEALLQSQNQGYSQDPSQINNSSIRAQNEFGQKSPSQQRNFVNQLENQEIRSAKFKKENVEGANRESNIDQDQDNEYTYESQFENQRNSTYKKQNLEIENQAVLQSGEKPKKSRYNESQENAQVQNYERRAESNQGTPSNSNKYQANQFENRQQGVENQLASGEKNLVNKSGEERSRNNNQEYQQQYLSSPSNNEQNDPRSTQYRSLQQNVKNAISNNDSSQNVYESNLGQTGEEDHQTHLEEGVRREDLEVSDSKKQGQGKRKSKKHNQKEEASENPHNISKKNKNLERIQEEAFENQSFSQGGQNSNIQISQEAYAEELQNRNNSNPIVDEKTKKKKSKETKENYSIQNKKNDVDQKKQNQNANEENSYQPWTIPDEKGDGTNVYSVYSRSNSYNQDEASERKQIEVSGVEKMDRREAQQTFKIQSETPKGMNHPSNQQGRDLGSETTPSNQIRLSKMSEEEAAAVYEQRRNNIQKGLKKISKKNKKSSQKNQNMTTPTNAERSADYQVQNLQVQEFSNRMEVNREESGHKDKNPGMNHLANFVQNQYSDAGNPIIKPKKVKSPKAKNKANQEFEVSKQSSGIREESTREARSIEHQEQIGSSTKKKQTKQNPKESRQEKDNQISLEHKERLDTQGRERSSESRTNPKKKVKEPRQIVVKATLNQNQITSPERLDHIKVARDGILLRMENIEKALTKEENMGISAPNTNSTQNKKSKLTVKSSQPNEGAAPEKITRSNQLEVNITAVEQKKSSVIQGGNDKQITLVNSPQNPRKTNQTNYKDLNARKIEASSTDDQSQRRDIQTRDSERRTDQIQLASKTPKQNEKIRIQDELAHSVKLEVQGQNRSFAERNIDKRAPKTNTIEIKSIQPQPENRLNSPAIDKSISVSASKQVKILNQKESMNVKSPSVKKNNLSYDEMPTNSSYLQQNQMKARNESNQEIISQYKISQNQREGKDKSVENTPSVREANLRNSSQYKNSQYQRETKEKSFDQALSARETNSLSAAQYKGSKYQREAKEISMDNTSSVKENNLKSPSQQYKSSQYSRETREKEKSVDKTPSMKESNLRNLLDNKAKNSSVTSKNQRLAESLSPERFNAVEPRRRREKLEGSFEERTRLWVIRKNQMLAENERKQYFQEQQACTFAPFSERGETSKTTPSSKFYEKNIEWSEKIKSENLLRMEKDLEEKTKPEQRKPRQRIAPFSPTGSVLAKRPIFNQNLEDLKNDVEFQNSSSNNKLKAYLDYEWKDDTLKDEINEIEELYRYVKSIVQTRLHETQGVMQEILPVNQQGNQTPVHKRTRTNSFSYKHKNPISRASSVDEHSKDERLGSLRKLIYNNRGTKNVNDDSRLQIGKENDQNFDKSIGEGTQIHDYLKNKNSKRLEIINNQYVIIDTSNHQESEY